MASSPSALDLSWSSPELTRMFEQYWASDPAFSEETLDAIRDSTEPVSPPRKLPPSLEKYILKADSPIDSEKIDGSPHPLFDFKNFITDLPMEEVEEQLLPVFRLATCLLTNERTLEWLAHVRYARLEARDVGPAVLLRDADPFSPSELRAVKRELKRLAGQVKFGWFGDSQKRHSSMLGFCAKRVCNLVEELDPLRQFSTYPPGIWDYDEDLHPSVFLSVEYFHQALKHRHHNTPQSVRRRQYFLFASTIVHELVHVWIAHCHPTIVDDDEPLIFPTDVLPEAGVAWEDFMFGGRLSESNKYPEHIISCSFANIYRDPRHYMDMYVPQAWVDQWFLKKTWADFPKLHASGQLYAPTVDRQLLIHHFEVNRFCTSRKRQLSCLYIYGYLEGKPCCDDEYCAAREPGLHSPWPSNPMKFCKKHLSVRARDMKAAEACGVEIVLEDYDAKVELMRALDASTPATETSSDPEAPSSPEEPQESVSSEEEEIVSSDGEYVDSEEEGTDSSEEEVTDSSDEEETDSSGEDGTVSSEEEEYMSSEDEEFVNSEEEETGGSEEEATVSSEEEAYPAT